MLDGFFNWLETSASSGVFLTLGVIGLVILVLSLLLDGVFDFLDFGDGPLSLITLGGFIAVGGFSGFAAVGFGASPSVAALIAAVVGLVGAVGAWGLSFFFKNSSTSSAITTGTLEGETGTVTLRIPGGTGFGEIAVMRSGNRYTFSAVADEPIPMGTKVRVITVISDTSVKVETVKPENQETN